MARIWKGDHVWKRLPFRVTLWELIALLELACYCLQAIGEVRFISLSKGSPFQVEWNFSTSGDGTKEELANLFLETRGNIAESRKTAESDSETKR
jgi:hypothetical protein